MESFRWIALAAAASAAIACSSLKVRPIGATDAEGIPFHLVKQEFVVETLGFDDKGKPADVKPERIALVARPDPQRVYRVTNDTHLLAGTEFVITRNTGGTIASISGESQDQTLETVTELVGVAARVAAFASVETADECERKYPKGKHPKELALCNELAAQKQAEALLVADLGRLGNVSEERRALHAKRLEDALATVRERIAAIEGKLEAKTKGVAVSKRTVQLPKPVRSYDCALAGAGSLKEDEIAIYLVPVDSNPAVTKDGGKQCELE